MGDMYLGVKQGRKRESGNRVDEMTFLQLLRRQFQISKIYYPGCQYDFALERAFGNEEIVYLDKRLLGCYRYSYVHPFGVGEEINTDDERNFILADYGKTPFFKNHVFDAIFYQDNHASEAETIEMLRKLRLGGIIIHSSQDCGKPECMKLESFMRLPGLEKVDLPFRNEYYTVFRKIADQGNPYTQQHTEGQVLKEQSLIDGVV